MFTATSFSVAEDVAAGSVVAELQAVDPEGQDVTYSLAETSTVFELNSDTGEISLLDGVTLDYETATSHSLEITASDGEKTQTETVVISVTDVNDTTPAPTPTPTTPGNSGGGGSIGWSLLGLLALLISRKTARQAEGKVT